MSFHVSRAPLLITSMLLLAIGCATSKTTITGRQQVAEYPDGSRALVGGTCVAERMTPEGILVVYRKTPTDVDKLVASIREDPVASEDARLLDPEFWLGKDTCPRMAGNRCSEGTCSSYSCKETWSGGIKYCSCRE